jgi:hypothetical protein
MGGIGEELVRIYMTRAAPPIQPAAIERQTIRGVLASVRIQAQFDILRRGWDDHRYQHSSECAKQC